MPRTIKLSGLAILFAAGLLLAAAVAVTGRAADTTTTETTSTVETTTRRHDDTDVIRDHDQDGAGHDDPAVDHGCTSDDDRVL